MTEQELRSKFQSDYDTGYTDENESGKLEYINCMSEDAAIAFAKAYADAETKELEEAYAELKSSYEKFYESDAVQHKQILALNAEIKRLRDALVWLKNNRTPDRAMIEVFIDKALSPAPVTETQNEDQS